MKYYLDEDVNPAVAQMLRQQGIDALSVHESGGRGLPDADHLARAAADGRCLVTRNRDDFIRLTVNWFATEKPHCGVLLIPHTLPNNQPARLADALAGWAGQYPHGLPAFTVAFLPRR